MGLPAQAVLWPTPYRYAAAAAAGVAWTLFGQLLQLGVHVGWFIAAVVVFVAPVLAVLGRDWLDEAVIVAVALVAAMVTSQILLPAPPSQWARLAADVSLAWTPLVLVTAAFYALRRRLLRV